MEDGDISDMVVRKASPRREFLKGELNEVREYTIENLLRKLKPEKGRDSPKDSYLCYDRVRNRIHVP